MGFLDFVILALAVFRISSLLAVEDGPFDIILRFRLLVGTKYNEQGQEYPVNQLAEAIMCQWCNSVWIAMGVALLWYFLPMPTILCLLPFALSAVTVLLNRD